MRDIVAARANAIFGVEARGGGGECAVMAATELIAPVAEYFSWWSGKQAML